MLPDRSKRAAGIDGEIPRLQLTSNWQLLTIALIMGGLLVMIFPHQALVEKLYGQERLDELTLSYIENLYRTDPQNADLAILLVRARHRRMELDTAERMLWPVIIGGTLYQRTEARLNLLTAYESTLERTPPGRSASDIENRAKLLFESTSREEHLPPRLASVFARSAFRLNLPEEGARYLQLSGEGESLETLERLANQMLGQGKFSLAADYFLLARHEARAYADARRLFHAGIAALMADSQYQLAMQSAEKHLGDLENDPETLRYLARSALAAGAPGRAALYAQRLIGADTIADTAAQNGARP